MNLTRFLMHAACGMSIAAASGCAARLPRYSWRTSEEALAILRDRAHAVQTVEAACDITLTSAEGESVSLDGAVVARNPGWLRMRAWKFNSPVFDLTLTPGGMWVMRGESPEAGDRFPREFNAKQVMEAWNLVSGGFFDGDVQWMPAKTQVEQERFIKPPLGRDEPLPFIHCMVERKTLTPQKYAQDRNGRGASGFDVQLDDYRVVNGIVFACKLELTSPEGRMVIRLHDAVLNDETAPNAFDPPARAVKQP